MGFKDFWDCVYDPANQLLSAQAVHDGVRYPYEQFSWSYNAAQNASTLAQKLAETAQGGDAKATLAAFATLGKEGCGGCHQKFRKPQS